MRRGVIALVIVSLLAVGAAAVFLPRRVPEVRNERDPTRRGRMQEDADGDKRRAGISGPNLEAACRLPSRWIRAVEQGWDDGRARDHDLAIIPKPPNYMGSITDTSHSGPYDFLQRVPLVFYGPGHIARTGPVELEREVDLVDVAPTMAAAMDFDFPPRDGRAIIEILDQDAPPPKLIVTTVIDGGGWNVLEHWPNAWPELEDLMKKGASIQNATVGSSPSITPATHTNLSTGLYPRDHGVTAIVVRNDEGDLTRSAFIPIGEMLGVTTMDATVSLKTTTLADEWDLANDNDALIGAVVPGFLQLGMIGAGAALERADKDIVAGLSKKRNTWDTNTALYSSPAYLNSDVRGPERDMDAVDRADGEVDGLWRGHDVEPVYASPALAAWENRTMLELIEREDFGGDDVTDLFYVNYKAPDAAGHLYNMIAPEQADTIASTSKALGNLVDELDETVGPEEYILIVTADHGQTPLGAGGWPIRPLEIIDDLNDAFDETPNGRGVIQETSAHTLFMSSTELEANGVEPREVADFLYDYRIADNVAEDDAFPPDFAGRENERIFETIIPGKALPAVAACAEPGKP